MIILSAKNSICKFVPFVCIIGLFEVIMAQPDKSLSTYRKKRNLQVSKEPRGGKIVPHKKPIFVIQRHMASHEHYDVRLEIDGVLTSWAVPKGPSTSPRIRRLAVMTEDHPIEYAKFEGIIPEGNYGAGTVMVWDYGTYRNIKEKDGKLVPMKQCLKNGTIEVFLDGHKLHGGYAFIKMHGSKFGNDDHQWLMIKMDDEYTNIPANPVKTMTKSARTNRTMVQIKKDAQDE